MKQLSTFTLCLMLVVCISTNVIAQEGRWQADHYANQNLNTGTNYLKDAVQDTVLDTSLVQMASKFISFSFGMPVVYTKDSTDLFCFEILSRLSEFTNDNVFVVAYFAGIQYARKDEEEKAMECFNLFGVNEQLMEKHELKTEPYKLDSLGKFLVLYPEIDASKYIQ